MIAKSLLVVSVACAACAAFAERQPLERYQSIIDRQMFGLPPKGFDPTKSPNEVQKTSAAEERQLTEEQAKLQSAVHFSVINVTSAGETEVGFTDNSDPKAPKHYYLKVGQSQDGWEVKDADPEKASMTIVKGDVELEMTLGDKSGSGTPGGKGAAGGSRPANSSLLGGGAQSLRSRRLQRQQREADARAEAEAKEAEREQARKAEAEAERQQREAEREEQRKQLLAIQEELKRSREAAAAAKKSEGGEPSEGEEN